VRKPSHMLKFRWCARRGCEGGTRRPTVSGLEPGSALTIALHGPHNTNGDAPLVVHADASGVFPGENGGVSGILGVDRVDRVTFSGTNTDAER
jgi:hypothetical protein